MVRNKSKKNKRKKSRSHVKRKSARVASPEKLEKIVQSKELKGREYPGVRKRVMFTFTLIMVALVGSVYFIGYRLKNEDREQLKGNTEHLIKSKGENWDFQYPDGYKVITLANNKVIESSVDTLPKDIFVDWKNISLARVTPEKLKDNPGLIKMRLGEITHQASGLNQTTIMVSFAREVGQQVVVTPIKKKELFFELLEVYENSMVCLFALR